MSNDVEKFIRIQRTVRGVRPGSPDEWRTIPNCDRVRVWEMTTADVTDPTNERPGKRFIFHIGYQDGLGKGNRVTYLGNHFIVLTVSDSTRLRGLELSCEPASNN